MIERTGLPAHRFYPTHINRDDPDHMEPAVTFVEMGGTIDLTAIMCPRGGSGTGVRIAEAFANLLNLGVPVERITFTSDGNVSMPIRNECREQIGLFNAGRRFPARRVAGRRCVRAACPSSRCSCPVTANPARVLRMSGRKGCIAVGAMPIWSPGTTPSARKPSSPAARRCSTTASCS